LIVKAFFKQGLFMSIKLIKIEEGGLRDLKEELRVMGQLSLSLQLEINGSLEIACLAKILSLRGKVTKESSLNALDEINERKERFLSVA
jgi:hypothetical protein